MPMPPSFISLAALATMAALAAGCSNTQGPDEAAQEPPGGSEPMAPAASEPQPSSPFDDFDADAARAEAQALIGLPEAELEQSGSLRIVRRGDERLSATMDLRPGRKNVELDEDDDGRLVVTRVVVETPNGDDLVVE